MLSNAWNKHFNLLLMAVVVVGLALGVAAASLITKPPPAVVVQPSFAGGQGNGANGFAGRQGGSAQAAASAQATTAGGAVGAAGRGVFGSVSAVDANANTMTVNDQQGDTKVNLSGARIVKTVDGSASDLQAGQRVTVVGQQQPDGSYAASTVQIIPANQPQRGGGQAGNSSGQNGATTGQGSPQAGGGNRGQTQQGNGTAGSRPLSGSVTSVNNGVLTLSTQQGDVKVDLSKATIEKTVDGTIKDLQAGQRVVVTGQAGSNGSYSATEVQILATTSNPAQGQRQSGQGQQPPAPTAAPGH